MSHSKVRWDFWNIISGGLMVLFLIFLVYPIGRLLKESVYTDGKFTMEAFRMFFSKSYYYESIFHSVKIAFCVMAEPASGYPLCLFLFLFQARRPEALIRPLPALYDVGAIYRSLCMDTFNGQLRADYRNIKIIWD